MSRDDEGADSDGQFFASRQCCFLTLTEGAFIDFTERGREKEKKGATSTSCLPYATQLGTEPQPRNVPGWELNVQLPVYGATLSPRSPGPGQASF